MGWVGILVSSGLLLITLFIAGEVEGRFTGARNSCGYHIVNVYFTLRNEMFHLQNSHLNDSLYFRYSIQQTHHRITLFQSHVGKMVIYSLGNFLLIIADPLGPMLHIQENFQ